MNGGSTISCSVQETCEDGVCGSADTIATETAPTGGDLCDAGSSDVFSAVLNTVTNEYEWMCLGA